MVISNLIIEKKVFFYSLVFYLFVSISNPAYTQLIENFDDGLLNGWKGDTISFIINNEGKLQLMANAEKDESFISISNQAIHNTSWEFKLRMDFNPSSSNFVKAYLVSDYDILNEELNGYYVMIGGVDDEISLYKQTGLQAIKIIDGTDDITDLPSVDMLIKVTREVNGRWALWHKFAEDTAFTFESDIIDSTFFKTSFFGFLCEYTSTRAEKFFFDDIVISGEPYKDLDSPYIISIKAETERSILIQFSEPINDNIDKQTVLLNNAINPIDIVYSEGFTEVTLSFLSEFESSISHNLYLEEIMDLHGNTSKQINKEFTYLDIGKAYVHDLVINELFVDPSPSLGLPEEEYIEIYNRSNHILNLQGYQLSDASDTAVLDSLILFPGEYIIICNDEDKELFSHYGMTMGIDMPSLNNEKDVITLSDGDGNIIDKVSYEKAWYSSSIKEEGGWSLEIIDPDNLCHESNNWRASDNNNGGTPGQKNSIDAEKPDLTGPTLEKITINGDQEIVVSFNEWVTYRDQDISIMPSLKIESVREKEVFNKDLVIGLSGNIDTSKLYTLAFESMEDCIGNIAKPISGTFVLPTQGIEGEIIISEILFNPQIGGVKFVEIYNRSDKYINLKGWRLANMEEDTISNHMLIVEEDFSIPPQSFYAITTDTKALKSQYLSRNESNFIEAQLPSYPSDEGNVVLVNNLNQFIDRVDYNEDMHFSLLKDIKGVSLERVNLAGENQIGLWKSASSNHGYATPGHENSQQALLSQAGNGIRLEPRVIVPDNFNLDHFTNIHYQFDEIGYAATVNVYNSSGSLIKNIANNEYINSQGFFTWDGTDGQRKKVRVGYYLVVFEMYNQNGETSVFKESVVVGTEF